MSTKSANHKKLKEKISKLNAARISNQSNQSKASSDNNPSPESLGPSGSPGPLGLIYPGQLGLSGSSETSNLAGPSQVKKKVTICYSAIFKNESRNVYRCLNALKPIIDYVCICDTGSTDNTIELINQWCKENNIPGYVGNEPFQNFGYNRTVSAQMTNAKFPEATYLLLIDADMVLEINPKFNKQKLDADSYSVKQYNPNLEYWNTRLIKNRPGIKCVGVTHEYWEGCGAESSKLYDIVINDKGDGGAKQDKYTRDERLLSKGLEDPNTPDDLKGRYMFYLAQTYRDMGQPQKAIDMYQKRIDKGGWNEEIFYSQLQIALCYDRMKSSDEATNANLENHAITAFLKAWNCRPLRAEPLYYLAKLYRLKPNMQQVGYLFAKRAKEVRYPDKDVLFVDHSIYNYLIDEELSILAYYVDTAKEEGKSATKRLLKNKNAPGHVIALAKANAKFYNIEINDKAEEKK